MKTSQPMQDEYWRELKLCYMLFEKEYNLKDQFLFKKKKKQLLQLGSSSGVCHQKATFSPVQTGLQVLCRHGFHLTFLCEVNQEFIWASPIKKKQL